VESGELLATAICAAETLGVPYMLVGSLASMRYGEPRLTLDFDIVVDLTFASAENFVRPSMVPTTTSVCPPRLTHR
jgi:hypothetical protein